MAELDNLVVRVTADIKDFDRGMRQAKRHLADLGGRVSGLGRSLTLGLSAPLALAGAAAVKFGTDMQSLTAGLTAVAGGSRAAAEQIDRLREVAKLPGLGFREAIQGSIRLQAVGVSAATAERALKAFGNAVATTGGGKSELDRITVQLGQLSAKGKILAQDLRPIIEAAPAVGKALREAFGTVDAQEIEALGLTSEQFLDRLLTQLETLPQVARTGKTSFEDLGDSLFRLGSAASRNLLPAITGLADKASAFFDRLEGGNPAVLQWGVALGIVAAAGGPLLIVLGKLTTAAIALSTALKVGMLPLIGVGGAVVLGLGALTAWFIKSKLAADDTTESAKALTEAFRELNRQSGTEAIGSAIDTLMARRAELAARPDAGFPEIRRQIAAIDIQLEHLRETYIDTVRELGTAAPPDAGGLARILGIEGMTGTLTEIRARLREMITDAEGDLQKLQDERAFETQADRAQQLADQIAEVTSRLAAMRTALASLPPVPGIITTPSVTRRGTTPSTIPEVPLPRSARQPFDFGMLGSAVSGAGGLLGGRGGGLLSGAGGVLSGIATIGAAAGPIGIAAGAVGILGSALGGLRSILGDTKSAVERAGAAFRRMIDEIAFRFEILDIGDSGRQFDESLEAFKQSFGGIGGEIGVLIRGLTRENFEKIAARIIEFYERIDELSPWAVSMPKELQDALRELDRLQDASEDAAEALNTMTASLRNVPITFDANFARYRVGVGDTAALRDMQALRTVHVEAVYVTPAAGEDPETFWSRVERAADTAAGRGNVLARRLTLAPAV